MRAASRQSDGLAYQKGGRATVYKSNLNGPGGFKPPTSDYAPFDQGGKEASNNKASRETGGRKMRLLSSKKCKGGLLYKCRGGRLKKRGKK